MLSSAAKWAVGAELPPRAREQLSERALILGDTP